MSGFFVGLDPEWNCMLNRSEAEATSNSQIMCSYYLATFTKKKWAFTELNRLPVDILILL